MLEVARQRQRDDSPVEGMPRATAEKLGPAMASALQEREIAASDKTASIGSYELVGRIQEMAPIERQGGAGRTLGIARSPRAALSASGLSESRRRRPIGRKGKDDAVARLAAASAAQLVTLLQDDAPTEAEIGGRTRLRIGGVDGSPGDGGNALARAITEQLKRQDLAIVTDPQAKADLMLDAEVTIARAKAGKQNVKIVWRIRARTAARSAP